MFFRPKTLFFLNPIPRRRWESLRRVGKETPVFGSTLESPVVVEAKEREPQMGEDKCELGERKKSQALWRKGSLWFVSLWEMAKPIPTPTVTAAATEVAMAVAEMQGEPFHLGGRPRG